MTLRTKVVEALGRELERQIEVQRFLFAAPIDASRRTGPWTIDGDIAH